MISLASSHWSYDAPVKNQDWLHKNHWKDTFAINQTPWNDLTAITIHQGTLKSCFRIQILRQISIDEYITGVDLIFDLENCLGWRTCWAEYFGSGMAKDLNTALVESLEGVLGNKNVFCQSLCTSEAVQCSGKPSTMQKYYRHAWLDNLWVIENTECWRMLNSEYLAVLCLVLRDKPFTYCLLFSYW